MALDTPTHNANEGTDGGDPSRVTLTAPDDDEVDDGGEGGTEQSGGDEAAARAAAGVPAQGARPAKAGGRAERRRIWEANEKLRTELGEAHGRIKSMEQNFSQQMKELREAVTARPAQGAAQGQGGAAESPVQQQLKTLKAAQVAELKAMRAHDPRAGEYDLTRYYEIQDQIQDLRTNAAIDAFLRQRGFDPDARPRPQQQQDPNAIAWQVNQTQLRDTIFQENAWMAEDTPAGQRARTTMGNTLKTLLDLGRPNTIATHREAAARVERELGMAPRRPARGNAQRYVDVGDDNRGTGGGRPTSVTVPADMLEGTGLPPAAIRRAVFGRNGQ